jgi:hypothetical protein
MHGGKRISIDANTSMSLMDDGDNQNTREKYSLAWSEKKSKLLKIHACSMKRSWTPYISCAFFGSVLLIAMMSEKPEMIGPGIFITLLMWWGFHGFYLEDMCELERKTTEIHKNMLACKSHTEMSYVLELARLSVMYNRLGYAEKAAAFWHAISIHPLADWEIERHALRQMKICLRQSDIANTTV